MLNEKGMRMEPCGVPHVIVFWGLFWLRFVFDHIT